MMADKHPLNGLFSTRKVKPIWVLMKQKTMGWQWHQLDRMQVICTSLQTDNHTSTSSLYAGRLKKKQKII